DEAAPVLARGGYRLGQFLGLQRWQITLQHNDIGEGAGYRSFGGGDRVVQRVAVAVGRRVGQHAGPERGRRGRRGVVGRDDGDRTQRLDAGRGGQGVHQHGQHHLLPRGRREDRGQPGLGGGQPLDG